MKPRNITRFGRFLLLTVCTSAANGAVLVNPLLNQSVRTSASPGSSDYQVFLDIDFNGTADFGFKVENPLTVVLRMTAGNRITGFGYPPDGLPELGGFATFLQPGDLIGETSLANAEWWGDPYGAAMPIGPGPDQPPDVLYIGLEFAAEDGIHYGYVKFLSQRFHLTPIETAWQCVPGESLAIPVPEPSPLLTLGTAGLLALSRRSRRSSTQLPDRTNSR